MEEKNTSEQLDYMMIVAHGLSERNATPGDVLTLSLCNRESKESMFEQAKRLMTMFVLCYHFWPAEVAVHPDHLTLIKKQEKSLDVLFTDEHAKLLGAFVNLADLPRRVPLVADDTLDLYTTRASYTFDQEWAEKTLAVLLQRFIEKYR